MNNVIVTTFWTDETYRRLANRLELSCARFGLSYHGWEQPDHGTWIENVSRKPRVILDSLLRWPHLDVLWLDADAEVASDPVLIRETDCDVAVFARDRRKRRFRPIGRRGHVELPSAWKGTTWVMTGTLFVRQTGPAIAFLDRWLELATAQPRAYQMLLCQQAIVDTNPKLLMLPQSYCAEPGFRGEPVIRQEWASTRIPGVVRC